MRNLLQKCHSMRVAVRREKDQAMEVFKQKYRNLEADLTHAHAIEFSQVRRDAMCCAPHALWPLRCPSRDIRAFHPASIPLTLRARARAPTSVGI